MDLLYTHQDILITMTSLKFASYLTCLCLWRLGKLGILRKYLYRYRSIFIVDPIYNRYEKLVFALIVPFLCLFSIQLN